MDDRTHLLATPFGTLCGLRDLPPGPYLRTTIELSEATCRECLTASEESPDYA